MYANDNTVDSKPIEFTININYDASPQWHLAPTYWERHIWQLDQEISIYEGPTANDQLAEIFLGNYDSNGDPQGEQPNRHASPTDVLQIPWTASYPGERTWTTGNRDGNPGREWFRCKEDHGTEDNTYLFRIVRTHDIHQMTTDSATPGCEGSALDLKIKVKDVGPPAPATGLKLTPQQNNNAKFNITWDTPIPNQFLEGTQRVEFPHESFNVTNVRVDFQPAVESIPTTDSTETSTFLSSTTGIQNIRGVAGQEYTVSITLINSEGDSQPVTKTILIPGPADRPEAPTVTAAGPTSLNSQLDSTRHQRHRHRRLRSPDRQKSQRTLDLLEPRPTTSRPQPRSQHSSQIPITKSISAPTPNNVGGPWSKPTPAKDRGFQPFHLYPVADRQTNQANLRRPHSRRSGW